MALEILRPETETMTWVTATQRLWVTADGDRLVEDGDPDAAVLFCIPGRQIQLADAERYGLVAGARNALIGETSTEKVGSVADGSEKVEASTGGDEPAEDLAGLTVKQLRTLAAERGVDVAAFTKKDEILAALAAAPVATEEAVEASTGDAEPAED